jgi:hypothetical protein
MTGDVKKDEGLIGYWNMNEGHGNRIIDTAWGHTGTGSLVEYAANTPYVSNLDTTGIAKDAPRQFDLYANSPNPFNLSTIIRFMLPSQTPVTLAIYNILGRRISTLIQGQKAAGSHEAVRRGTDDENRPVASGVYFCRIHAGLPGKKQWIKTRKMMLLK